jgi:hypothetical protein
MNTNPGSEPDDELLVIEKLADELPDMSIAPWEEGMRPDGTVPERKSFWALTVDDWRDAWRRRLRRHREVGAKG